MGLVTKLQEELGVFWWMCNLELVFFAFHCKKFSGAGHPLKRRKHVHQFDWQNFVRVDVVIMIVIQHIR